MGAGTIRLILGDIEAEVVEDALRLYLMARPKAHDGRYDRVYRVAQELLANLQHESRAELADDGAEDDERAGRGYAIRPEQTEADD